MNRYNCSEGPVDECQEQDIVGADMRQQLQQEGGRPLAGSRSVMLDVVDAVDLPSFRPRGRFRNPRRGDPKFSRRAGEGEDQLRHEVDRHFGASGRDAACGPNIGVRFLVASDGSVHGLWVPLPRRQFSRHRSPDPPPRACIPAGIEPQEPALMQSLDERTACGCAIPQRLPVGRRLTVSFWARPPGTTPPRQRIRRRGPDLLG